MQFILEKESLVVIVTSTTGDGEPPDTVQKFWRRIKRRTVAKDHFSSLTYAVLGRFCALRHLSCSSRH